MLVAFGTCLTALGINNALAHYEINFFDWCTAETFQDVMKAPLKRFNLREHPLVPNPQFESAIDKCMVDPVAGVFVLWSPPQGGKTNYLEECADRRSKLAGKFVVMVSDYVHLEVPNDILTARHIASPSGIQGALKDGQHVVFMLDAFDKAMSHFDREALKAWVVTMAQQSQHCGKFTVILSVAEATNAETVLGWNNNEKIQLCGETTATADILGFKWDSAQAEKFLGAAANDWSLDERKKFCQLAHRCGNVATIQKMKADKHKLTDTSFEALITANEAMWAAGIGVLASRPQAPASN